MLAGKEGGCGCYLVRGGILPRCFMMLRKETMTPEMGWRSAVAFPRRSALTIVRRASLRIRRPIASPEVALDLHSLAASAVPPPLPLPLP